MPKFTATPLASSYGSVSAINTNLTDIETAFQNTLSRDGSTPNQMEANLDMNGFAILNASNVVFGSTVTTYTSDVTLSLADASSFIIADTTTTLFITIPLHADVPFPVGTRIDITNSNTGTVSITTIEGVMLNAIGNYLDVDGPHGVVHLVQTAIDTWTLSGDIV